MIFGGWALGFEGVLVGGEGFWLSSLNSSGVTCHFSLLLAPSFAVLVVLLPRRLLVFVCRLLFDRL